MRTFDPLFASLRRMTEAEARAVRPRKIDIVTAGRGDTVASLSSRMAFSTYQADRFRVLNGLAANAELRAGQRVKLVVYGNR